MRVEYDRQACAGWFQCVQEWGAFEMDMAAGKADFEGATEEGGVFVREIGDDLAEEAKAAANSCPVDAIEVYADGELVAPTDEGD